FWGASALLAAVALLLVMRPLLRRRAARVSRRALNIAVYRDQLRELEADLRAGTLAQADYERACRELEARLLEDVENQVEETEPRRGGRTMMVLTGISIPALALAVYLVVGNPGAIDPQAAHGFTARQVEAMVERLATRLKDHPDDAEGWKLLGRSYSVLGRFQEAAHAYAKAAARAPRDAQLLADFADALGMAQGQRLAGDPEKLIARALEIDRDNLKALALAGTAAFERKDFKAAAAYWERMLPLVAAESEDARAIRSNMQEAKSLAGSTKVLKGTISLSSKLKQKTSPDDAVFIFARAAEGPPMPLAVLRKQVRDLPVAFSLDDSMAMAPGLKLSGFSRVLVGARISRSGNATPQPGDLQGISAPVANDATGVAVVIDTVR
ncbi:MAG: c-type cytochrome biogenesis protein CcmI, partial [Betaproteobacteria bacterium]